MARVIESPKHTNYEPGKMSYMAGFLGPRGNVGFFMVADYEKAKAIIEGILSYRNDVCYVEMGLDGDWSENSTTIWKGGKFSEYDCHPESQWAEPIIVVYFKSGGNEAYPVWVKGDPT